MLQMPQSILRQELGWVNLCHCVWQYVSHTLSASLEEQQLHSGEAADESDIHIALHAR